MLINSNNIDQLVRKVLMPYLIVLFIFTILAAVINYNNHHNWAIADWLINYSSGFIRRGLIGELLLLIDQSLNINIGLSTIIIQIIAYGIFFICSYLLLKNSHIQLNRYALLLFSPFIFTLVINNTGAGFRKEILVYALFSILCWIKVNKSHHFNKLFILSLFIYPLLILSHELLFIYLPYFFVLLILDKPIERKQLFLLLPLIILSALTFLISTYFKGNLNSANTILESLNQHNYPIKDDDNAIGWLAYSMKDGFEAVISFFPRYPLTYLIISIMSLIAFIPLKKSIIQINIQKPMIKYMLCLSLLLNLIIAAVALDWGRFLAIHLTLLFLIILSYENLYKISYDNFSIPLKTFIFGLIWVLIFQFQICCEHKFITEKPKEFNFYNMKNIIEEIILILN